MSRQRFTPIAVVGVSALFPGSLEKTGFWRDILTGKDLLKEIPESHWLIDDYYDPNPMAPDKTYAKRGAFLDDVPFDPMAWGLPPSIVPQTDTTQILALIVAKQVLEDAAREQFNTMDRSRISCILGVTSGQELMGSMVSRLQRPVWVKALRESGLPESEVQAACERISANYTKWEEAAFPGLLGNVVAGRIANRLDLGGTNCVTDAACASTFAALQMAVNELALGQSDLVIAGGCDTMNDIFMYTCFSKTPALSPSGDCRPFSDKADGTILGEGLGMVALKRLSDAEAAGDRIYAVIRGMGASSDGKALSVYAPLSKGQAKAVDRCYESAGYGPETVELIEAHGTGTKAGDAAEFEGLKLAFADAQAKRVQEGKSGRWVALGSVKSQIGHTKSAAGAASLVKTVLALHHKVLPPTIKIDQPNPKLDIEKTPFYLNTEARPWVKTGDHPRRAGVSSFGFGGTNFHVAVEEYVGPAERAYKQQTSPTELVTLGGETRAALAKSARELAMSVEKAVAEERVGLLRFLAKDAQARDLASSHARLAIVAENERDLLEKLRAAAEKMESMGEVPTPFSTPSGIYFEEGAMDGSVACLFPGQGSQYIGMGRDLAMGHDVARSAWDLAASLNMEEGTRLDEIVFPIRVFTKEAEAAQQARMTATEWAQPGLGATSLATYRLLVKAGVRASVLGGHSFGEVMALHAAGAVSADDALRIARKRGELMRDAAKTTEGAMCAVVATREKVEALVTERGLDVVLANHNAPEQVVLSGSKTAIASAEAACKAAGLTAKRLDVATAFHSPIVSGAVAPFAAFLDGISFAECSVPVIANATADEYPRDRLEAKHQLATQLGSPVRFVENVERMYAMGVRTFVEVGPANVLTGLVGKVLKGRPHRAIATDKKGAHGETSLQHALARLAVAGLSLKLSQVWSAFEPAADPRLLPLPKMILKINGSNYNKPYPPKGGKAALPKPNPERVAVVPQPAVVAAPRAAAPTPSAPKAAAAVINSVVSAPKTQPVQTQVTPPQAPRRNAMTDNSNRPAQTSSAWLSAYTEAQRQTAETHAAFAKSMADAHAAFLRSAEASFQSLARLAGAQVDSTTVVHTPAYVAPAYAAPAPVYAAPVYAAPVLSAPAPTHSAPVVVAPAPVAPPVVSAPAPVVAKAAPSVDLQATMLAVVAEKTGYPAEMITTGMELEADLGIDSIKRVEILSAVRERAPGLPEMDPGQLGALRTVGEIVEHLRKALGESAPASAAAPAAVQSAPATASSNVDLQATMLAVVAEKTGYPAEMITREMELEADLGIDSIKRVEILSAVRERAPGLPEMDPGQLGALRTVGQIVEHLEKALNGSAKAPVAASAAAPVAKAASVDLQATMLAVVAEKTGYPAEMITREMELEADLGIDSIKRVEILSAVRERAPGLPEMDPGQLGALRTVGQIVEHLEKALSAAGGQELRGTSALSALQVAPEGAPPLNATPSTGLRWVVRANKTHATGVVSPGFLDASDVIVTSSPLAQPLVSALRLRGVNARVSDEVAAGTDGVIYLGALTSDVSLDESLTIARRAFQYARALAPKLSAKSSATKGTGAFIVVSDLGGSFGIDGRGGDASWHGGLSGLVKTARQEWPRAHVRALDVEGASTWASQAETDAAAERIAQELTAGGTEAEVGLLADGSRIALESVARDMPTGAPVLSRGDVVVASGGARGVTAACIVELVQRSQCRVVLLGRSHLEPEPVELKGVQGDANLKRAVLELEKSRGKTLTPPELGKRVERILASREILATIDACRAAGGDAKYVPVDVQDSVGVSMALEPIRAEWGPVRALVHGAGVIADRFIAEKTDAQWNHVVDTKVLGLKALLDVTATDPLKAIVMFSSVAGRTGNMGQCDYATANEILNKVAAKERVRRAALGEAVVVRSLGWGPWEGGMVTPALKARFEKLGVRLVGLAEGAQWMSDELQLRDEGDVDVVLGGEPKPEALLAEAGPKEAAVQVRIHGDSFPFVDSHRVKGAPVLPAVTALDLFLRAARALHPHEGVREVRDLAVLKGIKLAHFDDGSAQGDHFIVRAEEALIDGVPGCVMQLIGRSLREDGTPIETRHYACKIVFGTPTQTSSIAASSLGHLHAVKDTIYDGFVLFHGPRFHAIESLTGESEAGIAGTLTGASALGWTRDEGAPTDGALLDGALQLAVFWTKHTLRGASLPTSIARFVPGTSVRPLGPATCVAKQLGHTNDKARFDLTLVDSRGENVARIEGLEVFVLPGSREQLAQQASSAEAE